MSDLCVVIPVYNGEEFIGQAIESILKQTYQDFKLLIINDCSTDRTKEVIESYNDKRIEVINLKENKGLGAAMNFALSKIKTKYIARLDADDIAVETRLEKQKKFLDNNEEIALVGGLVDYFPNDAQVEQSQRYKSFKSSLEVHRNSVVSSKEIGEKMNWYCCIHPTTQMFRTRIVKKIGYKEIPIGTDYGLFYELNKSGYKLGKVDEILVKMRVLDTSVTATRKKTFYENTLYKIKEKEINALLKNQDNIYIWGAGGMGRHLLNVLTKNGFKVNGFIDGDETKHGEKVSNTLVNSPDIVKTADTKCKIIIASQSGKFEVVKYLKSLSYEEFKDFLVYY